MTELSAAEKLEACIEWVENEIAKTLEEDPSGFLLGIQSVSVVEALREVAAERDALREALERIEDNAEAWHGDNEAKARALNVIAGWCREALEYRP